MLATCSAAFAPVVPGGILGEVREHILCTNLPNHENNKPRVEFYGRYVDFFELNVGLENNDDDSAFHNIYSGLKIF